MKIDVYEGETRVVGENGSWLCPKTVKTTGDDDETKHFVPSTPVAPYFTE